MGIYAGHNDPRSAKGERGRDLDGACFTPDQCDEMYILARDRGAAQDRWIQLDLPPGGNLVHHLKRGQPRWAVSLLKLDNGRWVSGDMRCWVAGPDFIPYPDRASALWGIVQDTINQAWRQYRLTGPQSLQIGIDGEELQAVTGWALGLLDRPKPRRVKRAQRKTLFEARREA